MSKIRASLVALDDANSKHSCEIARCKRLLAARHHLRFLAYQPIPSLEVLEKRIASLQTKFLQVVKKDPSLRAPDFETHFSNVITTLEQHHDTMHKHESAVMDLKKCEEPFVEKEQALMKKEHDAREHTSQLRCELEDVRQKFEAARLELPAHPSSLITNRPTLLTEYWSLQARASTAETTALRDVYLVEAHAIGVRLMEIEKIIQNASPTIIQLQNQKLALEEQVQDALELQTHISNERLKLSEQQGVELRHLRAFVSNIEKALELYERERSIKWECIQHLTAKPVAELPLTTKPRALLPSAAAAPAVTERPKTDYLRRAISRPSRLSQSTSF